MEVCRNAVQRKPVVVLRPGRSRRKKGCRVSHKVYRRKLCDIPGCLQAGGVTSARTVEDLYDFSKILIYAKTPRLVTDRKEPYKVAILTSSGGSGIIAVDCAEEIGIEIPGLSEKLRRLKEVLPPHCITRNPLDLTGDTSAERYETAVHELSSSNRRCVLLIFGILSRGQVSSKQAQKGS